ncbi:MAG: HAMP domain-containing protein, partial [Oceanidesulfovibrio sp.]
MTIRMRLLLLGIGVVLALSVLAGINYINGRSVASTLEKNELSLEESALAQQMREQSRSLNLLAMSAIVNRNGGVGDELTARMQAESESLLRLYPDLQQAVTDPQLQDAVEALGPELRTFSDLALKDLVELINESVGVLKRMEAEFEALDERMDSISMQVRAYLQILEQAYAERREKAALPGIWERYDTAVRITREAQLDNVKTMLVAMEVLNDRQTGEVTVERAQEIQDYGEFLLANIEQVGTYARSKEEMNAAASIAELVPQLLHLISVELPSMIRSSHTERLAIQDAFAGLIDALEEQGNTVITYLDTIVAGAKTHLKQSSAALERQVLSSGNIGVTIFFIVVAIVAVAMYLIVRSILVPLGRTVDFADAVASGDLDRELRVRGKDEFGRLAETLRVMVGTLKEMIRQSESEKDTAREQSERAREAMEEARTAQEQAETARRQGMLEAAERLDAIVQSLTSSARELSGQIEDASQGSARQSERASETATAMEEMNATVLEVARNASEAAQSADSAKSNAENGER